MNKSIENIKVYFRKRKNRISITGISIRADWMLIIILTSIALLGAAVYGFYVYNGISSGSTFEIVEIDNGPDLDKNKKDLIDTVKLLESRRL